MCKYSKDSKTIVPNGPACWACYEAYDKGGFAEEFPTWADLCQACVVDHDLESTFEKVVDIVEGRAEKDFNEQKVELVTRTGCRVVSRYILLKGPSLEKATQGVNPKDLKLHISTIVGEDGSESQRGLLLRHPAGDNPEVEVFNESFAQSVEKVLPRDRCLREAQSKRAHAFVLEQIQSNAARTLRMQAHTPTLQEVETRVRAYLAAQASQPPEESPGDSAAETAGEGRGKDDLGGHESDDDDDNLFDDGGKPVGRGGSMMVKAPSIRRNRSRGASRRRNRSLARGARNLLRRVLPLLGPRRC